MHRLCIRALKCLMLLSLGSASAAAQSPEAESYYRDNIHSTVTSKCIDCHIDGGRAGYTGLLFTNSAPGNHDVFNDFVNSPSLGARARCCGAWGGYRFYVEQLPTTVKKTAPLDIGGGEVHMGNLPRSVASSGITRNSSMATIHGGEILELSTSKRLEYNYPQSPGDCILGTR